MWSRMTVPLRVGLAFGAAGLALTLVGIFRGNVPTSPASIAMALLIGGGVWFLVAWAVATAAVDVERDVEQANLQTSAMADSEQEMAQEQV
jgi:hypothetical protein